MVFTRAVLVEFPLSLYQPKMILRILLLVCAMFISPSIGKMDLVKFVEKFENMCFQNEPTDPFRVNGQDTPLSNTLENFIALAEKFELANPTFDLKQELIYFISEYLFENIKYTNGQVDEWKIFRAHFETIEKLWDPDLDSGYMAKPEEPFSEAEQCSLYHMISHSILKKDYEIIKSYSPQNFSSSRVENVNISADYYYPQEIGAVAIRGTDVAVQLSKVLLGIYVGLKGNRFTDLNSYEAIQKLKDLPLPQDTTVDALYIVTMADILMQAAWTSDRKGLAQNGNWVSIPLSADKKIDGFCPMVYKQQIKNGMLQAYSYSSVRGAADGLILGLVASPVYSKRNTVRLSQILRMYYSPEGITTEYLVEDVKTKKVSFCHRKELIETVERKLQDQMLSFGYLIASAPKDVEKVHNEAKNLYNLQKGVIFDNSNTEIRNYCERSTSTEKPEDLPREIFLDVIVVLDSSIQESPAISETSFQEQQLITGYLANNLDLWHSGSRMTILLDTKISSGSGTSSKIELKPVVMDTYSSSCAACTVGQIDYDPSSVEREQIIVALDQFLQERKENEIKYSGVNGKVVVYFNYEKEDPRNGNNRIQGRLEKALADFHRRHDDIDFYAVGMDPELLKKYVKNDLSRIFIPDDSPEEVANKLYLKISSAPVLLKYTDCEVATDEKSATYENFVSPLTIQNLKMPAEYFYKSKKLSFMFESYNGNIHVCYNRAAINPENQIRNCKVTSGYDAVEFTISNPCKGFSKERCSPFYFSVMGMDTNGNSRRPYNKPRDYCRDMNDHWCRTLDQIKYRVSHTGVRCQMVSGCLKLNAPPVIILITALLAYFTHKKF